MSYEKYRDQKYLLVFLGAYVDQTAIPDISSKKTYENCIRSFSGSDNDLSFLIYVICVTFLSRQSQTMDILNWFKKE